MTEEQVSPLIPESAEGITPEWLSQILSRSFTNFEPGSMRSERIGQDYGFASTIHRVSWVERGERRSVVAKLWNTTADPPSKEVEFYQYFTEIGARIPQCYFAELDRRTARAVILLEDVTDATQGDVLMPATVQQGKDIATSLARMHARWQSSNELDDLSWLEERTSWIPDPGWLESRRQLFLERFPHRIHGTARELLDRIAAVRSVVDKRLEDAPTTLTHGDLHLDNILFEPNGQPVFLDWSRPMKAPLAVNLADLLFGMISPDHFDEVFHQYLATYNASAKVRVAESVTSRQIGGAFLRRFVMGTCGIARWTPTLARGNKIIEYDLKRLNAFTQFMCKRDPGLFESVGISVS